MNTYFIFLDWMLDLYNILILIILGGVFVSMLIVGVKVVRKYFLYFISLEVCWSCIPLLILMVLGFPSLWGLYEMESSFRGHSFRVLGAQWYWKYGLIDSNLRAPKIFRLISLDQELFVIRDVFYVVNISREDVLHSWALPRVGLKLDAIPGRLNVFSVFFFSCGGVFWILFGIVWYWT